MPKTSLLLLNVAKYVTYAFGLGLILFDPAPGVTPAVLDRVIGGTF